MSKKQLAALFVCNLIPYTVGISVIGLVPIHVIKLGADETTTGIYLSLTFVTLAIGTILSGWLSQRFQRRKLMILLAGAVALPSVYLMGQATSMVMLTIVTMLLNFAGGVLTGMINILAGMYAGPNERGRIFGIIGSSVAIANIIAGVVSGAIVDKWSFAALCTLCGLAYLVQLAAGFFLEDKVIVSRMRSQREPGSSPVSMTVWSLVAAQILGGITGFAMGFGRPIVMDDLGFNATSITSTSTIAGIVSLPMVLIVSWTSDRVGRWMLLLLSYLVTCTGAIVLIPAQALWHFWVSTALLSLGGAAGSLGLALVTDITTPENLGTAMSYFTAAPWISGVIGYVSTGVVMQTLGTGGAFLVSASLPMFAVGIVMILRREAHLAPA
jgi:MFS family permease